MFGRNSSSESKAGETPKPQAGGPQPFSMGAPSPAPATSAGASASVIGSDLTIIGDRINIIAQTAVLVDGEIRGDIDGRQVTVGTTGKVTGTITAQSIEIRGQVNGALKGTSVTLHPSAKVDGDILHQTLSIAEGAQFDGRVRRPKDASEITPRLDVASAAAGQGRAPG